MKDKFDTQDADDSFVGLDPEMMLQLVEALVEIHPDKSILLHEAADISPLEFKVRQEND